jgi:hypothetical protein
MTMKNELAGSPCLIGRAVCVLSLLLAFFAVGCETAAADKTRSIQFPRATRYSIGEVCVVLPAPEREPPWLNLRAVARARGPVLVPDRPICLLVSYDGAEFLLQLSCLGANDLQYLILRNTLFSQGELASITNLQGLRGIDFSNTELSDAALPAVAKFPNLEALELSRSYLTGEKLEQLGKLKHLTYLSLHHNGITDEGLKKLSACSNLRNLNIRATKATDDCCPAIGTLKELRYLSMSETLITDKGLGMLKGLPHLVSLTVSLNPITQSGVDSFSKACPKCKVEIYDRAKHSKQLRQAIKMAPAATVRPHP